MADLAKPITPERPLAFGELLDVAIRAVLANWKALLLPCAIVIVLGAISPSSNDNFYFTRIVARYFGHSFPVALPMQPTRPKAGLSHDVVRLAADTATALFFYVFVLIVTGRRLSGRIVSTQGALGITFRRLPIASAFTILQSVLTVVVAIALAAPYFFVRMLPNSDFFKIAVLAIDSLGAIALTLPLSALCVAQAMAVMDGMPFLAALRLCKNLLVNRGRVGRAVCTIALSFVISFFADLISEMVGLAAYAIAGIAPVLTLELGINYVASAVSGALIAVYVYDLRVRAEGCDFAFVSRTLGT